MDLIYQKVKKNILLLKIKNASILTAISGGKDSMSLLKILLELQDEFNIKIKAVYINHNLRGKESQKEEKFITGYCSKNNIPLFKKIIEKEFWGKNKTGSVEMSARIERYSFFKKICLENNIQYIATAHHLNDRIETFFLNLLRGCGIETLSSIPMRNKNIIRPLLNVTRDEIEKFIKLKKIPFIEDSSNKKNIYKRNIVRNKLIPVIKKIKSGYIGSFERFFNSFEEEKLFINKLSKKILRKITVFNSTAYTAINSDKYKKMNPVLQKNIVKLILKKLNYPVKPNKNMLRILSGNKKKYSYKSGSFNVLSKNSLIWFIDKNKSSSNFNLTIDDVPCKIKTGNSIVHFEKSLNPDILKKFTFAVDKIKFPILVRNLDTNDRIFITQKKSKSIKSILSENKIPELLFNKIMIFEDADKKIIGFIFNKIFRVSYNYYIVDFNDKSIIIKITDDG